MDEEPAYPPLRVEPGKPRKREPAKQGYIPSPRKRSPAEQEEKFGPKFARLAEVLNRDPSGLALLADATGLAPERLLVMQLAGAVERFAEAVGKVAGLELLDVEELDADEAGEKPVVYLLFPDVRALQELASLWERWRKERELPRGFAPWRDVFALLRDLRPWGPEDRLSRSDREVLEGEIAGRSDEKTARLELELVFRKRSEFTEAGCSIEQLIEKNSGRVLARACIDEIAYHALLVELPVRSVREILDQEHVRDTLAWADPIMHIRPQAEVDVVPPEPDAEEGQAPEPPEPRHEAILALLDGVPVAKHPRLARHLIVEDLFDLERRVQVAGRKHGTAMASLVVWGDLRCSEPPLPRKIVHIPVLGDGDRALEARLFVDVFFQAMKHITESEQSKDIVIVNLSLGNANRVFQGVPSPWARLVNKIAFEQGYLFVISAGNHAGVFPLCGCATSTAFEKIPEEGRMRLVLHSIDARKAQRRLLSPAESVNALTVGAVNAGAPRMAPAPCRSTPARSARWPTLRARWGRGSQPR